MGLEKSFRGKCSSSAVFFLTSVICFPHLASCIYFLALGSRYIFPARIRYLFPALCIRYQFPAFGDCYLFPALCIRYPFPTLGNSYSFLALGTRYLFPAFGTHFGRRPLVEWGTRGKSSLPPPPPPAFLFPFLAIFSPNREPVHRLPLGKMYMLLHVLAVLFPRRKGYWTKLFKNIPILLR